MLTRFALVAQPEEQEISNLPVAGSIPAGRAKRQATREAVRRCQREVSDAGVRDERHE